ncbi:threonylcarbamoyl-AMP synthase [Bacteroidia bacterium]|nr:threonylcarbamoyl-AMP synthase [Bacteroidia bacterium]
MIEEIRKACEVLKGGGVILYPTDTVWGIGCDATNEKAVQRIYDLKRREDHKAMLVLVGNAVQLQAYVEEVPDVAWQLVEVADKPLTIIYDRAKNLAPNLPAADGSIGIRVTGEAFSKGLCERFHRPVVSTSANVSGQPSPAGFVDIPEEIKNGVDYIVNYRRGEAMQSAQPSSIIKVGAGGLFRIIR